MHDLWPTPRIGPQPQALHFRYEKAGLVLDSPTIPWNAEAVLVEALIRQMPGTHRNQKDFHLCLAEGNRTFPLESFRSEDVPDRCRLFFRLPVPARSSSAEVFWRNRSLGQMTLPILGREDFCRQLGLQMPTLSVCLGTQAVACQTFVASQCEGLIATALLTSATCLAPILDLALHVEIRGERSGQVHEVPVPLTSSQLRSRQALISVVPPRPRKIGAWTATWKLGETSLASQRIKGISRPQFQRSLRISETRFVLQNAKGEVSLARLMPAREGLVRVGPCFLVSSREQGMAGLCTLQVRAQVADALQPPLLLEQQILITDGPTPFAPGTLAAADLAQVGSFELRLKDRLLGALPLTPAPTATFSTEGGFQPAPDFAWSGGADDLLNEKLNRLLGN